jgi:hypothetical protein
MSKPTHDIKTCPTNTLYPWMQSKHNSGGKEVSPCPAKLTLSANGVAGGNLDTGG